MAASGGASGADGRGDADDFAAQVDERPARVSRVDGRVGLNEVLDTQVVLDDVHLNVGDGLDGVVWVG